MAPAFSSTKQAVGFALLLLLVLLLPVMLGKRGLPPREELYSMVTWRYGPFPYMRQQIFEEKSDIDILFIGSSRLWTGIDTPYVQHELSKKLGRPAVVQTLGWAWDGWDALYFIAQDLLQHRKVHMIVFHDETRQEDGPHPAATYWFRFGDNAEALKGLPLRIQLPYYFAAILGMPQNLVSCVRPNLPEELDSDPWRNMFHSLNIAQQMGTMTVESIPGRPFVPLLPNGDIQSSEVCVYSPATQGCFSFSSAPIPGWQLGFAQKFANLAKAHGTRLVHLSILPDDPRERDDVSIPERAFWPAAMHADVAMVGVPSAKLYSGIPSQEVDALFYMLHHFNENGQRFFTRLVTPSLLQLYAEPTIP